ncbi:hypothetical protein M409DRAFT_29901 [Zasmidium cellare ATCC 36951]|uniref:Peptidase S53 domain-containing protein n=1 Tax=Zasmidium cellare ATCC 36951 TaxID=1080233 RepID=A0A6A6C180_ZASCE|nr:uncharacterized protein M409DRAFT_29901 [Zasmidium cellare ATCC 36951]KAF2159582.1 hypothetical protein M409DRAFT_29901 [Zasmidium cellare ATCC 36951]
MRVITIFVAALSAVRASHVLHERREGPVHASWRQGERVEADAIIPMRIGLKQTNLEAGVERLNAVSHPDSEQYGKHLSAEEVNDLFAPSQHSIESVRDWLIQSGINETAIAHSDNRGWIAADVPAGIAEDIFRAQLYEYESVKTGSVRIGCHEYRLPAHLVEHIDYVTPGVKMSAVLKKRAKRSQSWGDHSHHRGPYWKPTRHGQPPHHYPPGWPGDLPEDVRYCGGNITPACWRYLYKLPFPHINDSVNAAGLFEQGDYFAQSDISMYFHDPNNGGGSDRDIDVLTSLIYPQSVVVYQVDDANYAQQEIARYKLFNTFLDAIDGSYCNYTAYGITGDSPGIDPTYPDPAPNGYKGQRQCGAYKLTRVISIGYGESELDFPKNYVLRQCNEFMKLSLQGHTILITSGGFGFGSGPGDPTPSGCLGPLENVFNSIYPNGCPWVTSVGSTMLGPNQTVNEPESALQMDVYEPGLPEAFNQWRRFHDPGYPNYVANADASNLGANGGRYNRAGRGWPDISANGAYVPYFVNGEEDTESSSTIAAPIVASVITLINQQRTIAGKGPVGFINPALYNNPWMLNDITNGSNANCQSDGFKAVQGWDPVTGLGTPNYPKMLKYFMSLP